MQDRSVVNRLGRNQPCLDGVRVRATEGNLFHGFSGLLNPPAVDACDAEAEPDSSVETS